MAEAREDSGREAAVRDLGKDGGAGEGCEGGGEGGLCWRGTVLWHVEQGRDHGG